MNNCKKAYILYSKLKIDLSAILQRPVTRRQIRRYFYDVINNKLSLRVVFKIEANREKQRVYIFTRLKLGDNLKKIHDD